MQKAKPYIISVLIALAVGGLSALFTMGNMDIYDEIIKPSFAPPGIVFPIVWGILYVLMGISSARIYIKGKEGEDAAGALTVYILQLFVNFLWSIIFFNMEAFLFSFVWIILLWVLIVLMIRKFYDIDVLAAYLQVPYLIWVTFAAYLNLAIYLLN